MREILIIIKSKFKIIFRKNIFIYFLIFAPLILIGVSNQIYQYSSESIRVGIYDGDESDISRAMVNFLKDNKKITTFDINEEALESFVANSIVHASIFIPINFQRDIIDGKFESMKVMTLKNNEVAVWIKNFVNNYIATLNDIAIAADGENEKFFDIYTRLNDQNIVFSKVDVEDRSTDVWVLIQSIGLMLPLMSITGLVVANYLIKDRNKNLEKRIRITEISRVGYICANGLVVVILNFIQVFLFMIVIQIIMKNINLETILITCMLLAFSFVSAGISMILMSTRITVSKSNRLFAFLIIPSSAVSGCFWQLRLMPESLQRIAGFLPQGTILSTLFQIHTENNYSNISLCFGIIIFYSILFIGGSTVIILRKGREKKVQMEEQ